MGTRRGCPPVVSFDRVTGPSRPVRRCGGPSSQVCRISTAAAWSMTRRCACALHPAVGEHAPRRHGGEPLVGHRHRHPRHPALVEHLAEVVGVGEGGPGRGALAPGERAGQTHDHLHDLVLGDEHRSADPGRTTPLVPIEGNQRRGEHPGRDRRARRRRAPRRRRPPAAARRGGHRQEPAAVATCWRRASMAAPIPASTPAGPPDGVPPPWARSGLPPPRPPTAGANGLHQLARGEPARRGRPRWWRRRTTPSPRRGRTARRHRDGRRAGRARRRRGSAGRRRDPVGGAGGHQRDPADVLGAVGQRAGRGQHLAGADVLQLLLGRAQPVDDAADALGQLLDGRLELLGELGDQHVLAVEVAEGVEPDEGLDAAHAGARPSPR